jgi:hypothetical protein
MQWLFWQHPVPQKLSDRVKKSLIAEFPLDPQVVDKMLSMSKKGRFAGRQVRYMRIFDPALVQESEAATLTYDNLQRAQVHGKSLLFEGHTEKILDVERVYLSDRRTPATLFPL